MTVPPTLPGKTYEDIFGEVLLTSSGQNLGCCSTSCNAQESPKSKEWPGPRVSASRLMCWLSLDSFVLHQQSANQHLNITSWQPPFYAIHVILNHPGNLEQPGLPGWVSWPFSPAAGETNLFKKLNWAGEMPVPPRGWGDKHPGWYCLPGTGSPRISCGQGKC